MLMLLTHEIAIRICGVFMNSVWHVLRSENTIPMLQLDINISNIKLCVRYCTYGSKSQVVFSMVR